MFLSIVIPIYNDEKFLNECLDSCLDQGLSEDEYEIICVDDGSTDRTPEILREYESKHRNIRLIFREHVGYGGREVGFQAATGDFVWFVDHDDLVAPHAVDTLWDIVRENPEYDRINFPSYEFFDALTEEEKRRFFAGTLQSNDDGVLRDMAAWPSILRISFMRENGISPRSHRIKAAGQFWGIEPFRVWSGDRVFIEECIDKGIRTLRIEGKPLYYYRRHPESETMCLSGKSKSTRAKLRYHTALIRGHLAIQKKQEYFSERIQNGCASQETTVQMILLLRMAVGMLSLLPGEFWREGMRHLMEKDALFSKRPEEYDFRLRDYLKTRSVRERLNPATIAYYYLFTPVGARWFRLLTTVRRFVNKNNAATQLYRAKKRKRLRNTGVACDH